jgi:hypothetical protein
LQAFYNFQYYETHAIDRIKNLLGRAGLTPKESESIISDFVDSEPAGPPELEK